MSKHKGHRDTKTDKEKEEYSVALKEQLEQENANPRPTEMVAWVAVVRKEPLDGGVHI